MHERRELALVELAFGAQAGAQIDPERPDTANGRGHVGRREAAGEEDRHRRIVDDAPADLPVVHLAGAAQEPHRRIRAAAVEQQRIDQGGYRQRLGNRLLAGDVDYLHQPQGRQLAAETPKWCSARTRPSRARASTTPT